VTHWQQSHQAASRALRKRRVAVEREEVRVNQTENLLLVRTKLEPTMENVVLDVVYLQNQGRFELEVEKT
jgi:hypothetical protein